MDSAPSTARLLPIGAEPVGAHSVHFRLWAPDHQHVTLVLEKGDGARVEHAMAAEGDGYFSVEADGSAGLLYRYRLGDAIELYPDPASRFQPQGPRGPSQVVDARSFSWTDAAWTGVVAKGQVIYEFHVGTFTPEGTWAAATGQLDELARLGVTLLEIMPIAEFPGRFGWSYDGVNLFAPSHVYGAPDDFRRFVDAAHRLGIGVALDVVYNHFGLAECSVTRFAAAYASARYKNEWGAPINFDGESSGPVREFFLSNVRHWIAEYHLDGVRIDATQAFFDASRDHILGALVREARSAAEPRSILVIAESEPQDARNLHPPEEGGFGMDMAWNDDFHHMAMVRATGRREAYYTDYFGSAREFVAALRWGYLYQGQRYQWQGKRRGTPTLDLPAAAFVNFLQNHDQLANSAQGQRGHELTSPGRWRALTAVLLLGPGTPLLFQGQEFGASTPFLYFADSPPELAKAVADGRRKFLEQFPSLSLEKLQSQLPDPSDEETFVRCRLNFDERQTHAESYRLHADLIRLRRYDECISIQDKRSVEGAVLNDDCFLLRYFHNGSEHPTDAQRLLIVNFGHELRYSPAPEPLLAPPANCQWQVLWTSEDPNYGGLGTPELETDEGWRIPAECAALLVPHVVER